MSAFDFDAKITTSKEPQLAEFLKPRGYKRQPKDPKEKFKLTIHGFLIDYLRKHGRTQTSVLEDALEQCHDTLRTKSGNRYRGNPARTLAAGLSNKKLFSIADGYVSLNLTAAAAEEETAMKAETSKSKFSSHSQESGDCNRIKLLKRLRKDFLETEQTAAYITKPLPGITGNEDLLFVANKLGQQQFIGMIQGYVLSKQYFISKINSAPADNVDGPIENSLGYIQKKLKKIYDMADRIKG